MRGYRKLIVVILVVAAATFQPLNPNQANVLIAVLCTFVVGNSVEHLSNGELREKAMALVGRLRGGGDFAVDDRKKDST